MTEDTTQIELKEFGKMEASPLYFIMHTWGLIPQVPTAEHKEWFKSGLLLKGKDWDRFCAEVKPDWFEPYLENYHLTWQQSLVLYGIEKSLQDDVHKRISIVSGNGVGKSSLLAMTILWFLFVHPDCQVSCTAPGATTLFDVLWKELHKWIHKMPKEMGDLYEWQTSYVRMKERPETWFARAKTSSKENSEALAGIHAEWVLVAVDEASGVEEIIYEVMEGSLTGKNTMVILISNGTRAEGYFYETHHKDKARWQTYAFSSLDSPRVTKESIEKWKTKYGADSVQYDIHVKGIFPDEGVMDDKGYVPLFSDYDIHMVPFDHNWKPVGRVIGALDASGEGQDVTAWAIRDRQRAAIVGEEAISSAAGMATRSITLMDKYGVNPEDFFIDAFGAGHAVSQEIALATQRMKKAWRVEPINSGEPCDDETDFNLYVNKRAKAYYELLKWFRQGGEVMEYDGLRDELLSIRFKRTENGRVKIMSKVEMKRRGYNSPDKADALSYTMLAKEKVVPSWMPTFRKQRIHPGR